MLLSNFGSDHLPTWWFLENISIEYCLGTLLGGGWSTTTTGRGGRRSRRNSSTSLQPTSPSSVQSELSTIAAIIFISRNNRRGFKWKLGGWKPLIIIVNATAKNRTLLDSEHVPLFVLCSSFSTSSDQSLYENTSEKHYHNKNWSSIVFVLFVSKQCLSVGSICFSVSEWELLTVVCDYLVKLDFHPKNVELRQLAQLVTVWLWRLFNSAAQIDW